MGRRVDQRSGVAIREVSGWVLTFGGSYFPDDAERQAEQHRAQRIWRDLRAGWLADNGVTLSSARLLAEHRRRRDPNRRATDTEMT
jgi:hypothetical protein